jgi:Tol biopolymer transport system component
MGEIYRARDPRLGREAAIKVLPAAYSSDAESLRRFEKEARAASALNHPNIVTVYEVGREDAVSFIAMELVDGRNLREVLAGGPLPLRKTLEIGGQIADGLAAAHERGLVHRDLKPQNVMVGREGRVKILDFGLVLWRPLDAAGGEQAAAEHHPMANGDRPATPAFEHSLLTTPGTILGTVGYMSPEQARGEPTDFRSDQFSLGVVLYELATGRRAFERGSAIETLSAILRDEPAPLTAEASMPAPFAWIVERCLAKEPDGRYASTRDLASDIRGLWGHLASASGSIAPAPPAPRRRVSRILGTAAALLTAALLGGLAVWRWRAAPSSPVFEQLTFRRGSVWSARFAPDGRTVIYGAAWDGQPFRLFRKGPHGAASRELELPDANLLDVSPSGQLAAALESIAVPPGGATVGTMAVAPLEGGAPREIQKDVLFADWTPDGRELAVARFAEGHTVVEFPAGRKVYETDAIVTFPRVSPGGDLLAFLDHPSQTDDRGTVIVVDRAGKARKLTEEWASAQGLAWHPSGREIWFGASPGREAHAIHAVTLGGRDRIVARAPGDLTVQDISADGRVLVTRESWRVGVVVRPAAGESERDVSWLDFSLLTGLSRGGDRVLFAQSGASVDTAYESYLRRLEDASPMFVGEGFAQALSPDGDRVLSIVPGDPPQLFVRPTGAGSGPARRVEPKGVSIVMGVSADWFPDGRRIVVAGSEPNHGVRLFACDLETGASRAITPEGIVVGHYQGIPVSPDGSRVAAVLSDGRLAVFSTEGGEPRAIPNLEPGMVPVSWTDDGRRLYAYHFLAHPARVVRVDPETGASEAWRDLRVADTAGVHGLPSVRITSDGKAYAYSYYRALSELFAVEGLR